MFRTAEEEVINFEIAPKAWPNRKRAFSSFSFFEKQDSRRDKQFVPIEDVKECKRRLEEIFVSNHFGGEHGKRLEEKDLRLIKSKENHQPPFTELNASHIGDFPAHYTLPPLEKYQFPAIGVYIDPRIIPGFQYLVRKLPDCKRADSAKRYLFHGEPLTLLNIGRGYARRFTFETNKQYSDEENYFYSDNHRGGYAFELQVISGGAKFTIYDVNHEPQGILDVIEVDKRQVETDLSRKDGRIVRNVRVKFVAKVELYDSGVIQRIPLSGSAICIKNKSQRFAKTIKIVDVNIRHNRYYLVQGYQEHYRKSYVKGDDIGDVPTKYAITGLSSYEMPVIGTYVDPRILPGFHYKVRLSNRKKYLFNAKPLRLQSIGIGYGKRLTFESDSQLNADNFLWSDSHHDGLAFEVRVVMENMQFWITSDNQILGEATVFRADLPQVEERMEKVELAADRFSYIKYVHIDVMCHIRMDINESGDFHNENLVRVYGLAIARKDPGKRNGYVERVENIALDSQLNLIFARARKGLTFTPKY
ncbi:hypothetical protein Trydic_g15225 [Trypoxylus dichotomus]